MTQAPIAGPVWEALQVGEELPSYEYLLTQEMLDAYRRVVENPNAAYPTIAGRHPDHCFRNRYADQMRLPNCGQESEYFQPPVPEKRIRVTGRIADKYIRRGKAYVVVEATSVDEDDHPIETSRLIGLAIEGDQPAFAAVARKWEVTGSEVASPVRTGGPVNEPATREPR